VLACSPFFDFALSLSLGDMGVLRTLAESGVHASSQRIIFVSDECRQIGAWLLVSHAYQQRATELALDTRIKTPCSNKFLGDTFISG
jgi:hypothetical protein